jgi:streptogramin lyase
VSFGTWVAEIAVPSNPGAMGNIRALLDGTIAFTEGTSGAGNWGLLNPSSGVVTEVAIPVGSTQGGICDTGDGRVAYCLSASGILVVCNRDGSGSHQVSFGGAGGGEPILGPDGQIWVAGAGGNNVKSVSLSTYAVTSTVVDAVNLLTPHSMTVGGDGRLWVSCLGSDRICAITTAGVLTAYQPAAKYQHANSFQGARVNPVDGKIYYSRGPGRCTLGRLTTAGVFDAVGEWALQTPYATPTGIAIDAAGNIWVGCRGANRVECYNTNGQKIAAVNCPTPGGNPNKLTYANGLVYVAEWNASKIGVIQAV